ncbi:MAG: DUF839 domain-containing protein, partial [Proteobacteria bacterium]|nr:DUF839 domain-containing protein [Pseudomonadota bacterium]
MVTTKNRHRRFWNSDPVRASSGRDQCGPANGRGFWLAPSPRHRNDPFGWRPGGCRQHAIKPVGPAHAGLKSVACCSAAGDLEADATVKSTNFILTGTSRNCSGGASPYGWLSCEETEEDGH